MDIPQAVRHDIMVINDDYVKNAADHYNFWTQHVRFVVNEAKLLADAYQADREIVCLGALLHDIALMSCVGTRSEHHTVGCRLAEGILTGYGYPAERLQRVLGCVLHHRSSKNAENIEELCVADADILAHYDNIPMCFHMAYKSGITDIEALRDYFTIDYRNLSEQTREVFKPRFEQIMEVLFGSFC